MRKLSLRKFSAVKISTRSTSRGNWTNNSAFSLEHLHKLKTKHNKPQTPCLWSRIKILMGRPAVTRVRLRTSANAKASTSHKPGALWCVKVRMIALMVAGSIPNAQQTCLRCLKSRSTSWTSGTVRTASECAISTTTTIRVVWFKNLSSLCLHRIWMIKMRTKWLNKTKILQITIVTHLMP